MDTVRHQAWTTESFLAWENKQEYKNEFDGHNVIPMTGGSVAHQVIVFNLLAFLRRHLIDRSLLPLHEMRLRIGARVRYPDVLVSSGPLEQSTRTLTDALAVFEVISLRCYVVLEQTAAAATLFRREHNGAWIATAHTDGALVLPGLETVLHLGDVYEDLTFPPAEGSD
jgi:hypothetical protein